MFFFICSDTNWDSYKKKLTYKSSIKKTKTKLTSLEKCPSACSEGWSVCPFSIWAKLPKIKNNFHRMKMIFFL